MGKERELKNREEGKGEDGIQRWGEISSVNVLATSFLTVTGRREKEGKGGGE